jgi:hypothetical protein
VSYFGPCALKFRLVLNILNFLASTKKTTIVSNQFLLGTRRRTAWQAKASFLPLMLYYGDPILGFEILEEKVDG